MANPTTNPAELSPEVTEEQKAAAMVDVQAKDEAIAKAKAEEEAQKAQAQADKDAKAKAKADKEELEKLEDKDAIHYTCNKYPDILLKSAVGPIQFLNGRYSTSNKSEIEAIEGSMSFGDGLIAVATAE